MDYEKSIGVIDGYSRGRYCLHHYGEWPDDEKLLEMYRRQTARRKPKTPKACSSDFPEADHEAPLCVDFPL